MEFVSVAVTDAGRIRKVNEDAYLIQTQETIHGTACLAAVCDGVGGLQYGDRACKYVTNRLSRWFQQISKVKFEVSANILQQLNAEIEVINEELRKMGQDAGTKIGTTLSGILLIAGEYFLFHIGDTRIYMFSENLRCLTFDHTVVAAKLRNGQITEQEAESGNEKHVLLQCMGVSPVLEIQNMKGYVHKDDVFFLCSDGQYNTLNIGEVEDILEEMKYMDQPDMQQTAETLVGEVMKRGERDNITAIYIKIKE